MIYYADLNKKGGLDAGGESKPPRFYPLSGTYSTAPVVGSSIISAGNQ
jgi:hypothetical protein